MRTLGLIGVTVSGLLLLAAAVVWYLNHHRDAQDTSAIRQDGGR